MSLYSISGRHDPLTDLILCSFKDFFAGIVMGNPNAKPVPEDPKDRPVQVVKPNFDHSAQGIKATWIGHASWLVGKCIHTVLLPCPP